MNVPATPGASSGQSGLEAISPGQSRLGPSPAELWQTYRLPGLGIVLGAGLTLLAGLSRPTQPGFPLVFGLIILISAVSLAGLEWRDRRQPWLRWDGVGLTWGDRRQPDLSVTWPEIASLRLRQVNRRRHLHLADQQLWLELRPVNWSNFVRIHPQADRYASTALPDFTIGLRASRGARHRAQLDRQLGQASLPGYLAPANSEADIRFGRSRPTAADRSSRPGSGR